MAQTKLTTPFFSEKTINLQPGEVAVISQGNNEAQWLAANIPGQSLVMVPAVNVEVRQSPGLYNAIQQALQGSQGQSQQYQQGDQQQEQQGQQGQGQHSRRHQLAF